MRIISKLKTGVLSLMALCSLNTSAQQASDIPLVYEQENSFSFSNHMERGTYKALSLDELTPVSQLRNPLQWYSKNEAVNAFDDWEGRRNEIAGLIQQFGIGEKPAVSKGAIKARMDADTLIVDVTVNGNTLTLRSEIRYPQSGTPPYALMIGTSGISLPRQLLETRPIATMVFHEAQVNGYSQWRAHGKRGEHPFDMLYPHLKDNGAYSEWAWGLSRLIDGLQLLGEQVTRIDARHIGVTGCSYAGKMALFCGAFDERIALTIAQEPGGGGAAAWRASRLLGNVESLERTDYNWFLESMKDNFSGDSLDLMPYDHHELCAMVCPRALLVLGNTDYEWLADESALVSLRAARKVWQHFGIQDRMGFSIMGGHPHCQLPKEQFPEVEAFIDRFLLGKEADTRNVQLFKP